MKRLITPGGRGSGLPPLSFEFAGRRVLDLPLIVWLTIIWVMLWSTLTWANVVTGVVVAVLVCLAFPLPRVDLGLRLHVWGVTRLAGYLLYDMYTSGVRVTQQIFVSRPHRPAVIGVPLRCRSDLMLAATAVAVSNVPGGSIIEVRRATATVFVHVLDADLPGALDAARQSVWRLEELTVRAFGTREEIERVAAPPPTRARQTGPTEGTGGTDDTEDTDDTDDAGDAGDAGDGQRRGDTGDTGGRS